MIDLDEMQNLQAKRDFGGDVQSNPYVPFENSPWLRQDWMVITYNAFEEVTHVFYILNRASSEACNEAELEVGQIEEVEVADYTVISMAKGAFNEMFQKGVDYVYNSNN